MATKAARRDVEQRPAGRKARQRPATTAAINSTCPWSGDPVRADSLTVYRGKAVGSCNPGCRDKFAKATALFDAAIANATEMSAVSTRKRVSGGTRGRGR